MNILFISYWGINEGLSQATVLPHVQLLASLDRVDKVILCTIERGKFESIQPLKKISHVALVSKNYKNVLLNKLSDFTSFTHKVNKIVKAEHVELIICRSSLAGGIGYQVSKKTKVPYVVESFEPHASYMLESGVWSRWDPRYLIEIYFQRIQRQTAKYLLPVSSHYAEFLFDKKVSKKKVIVVPCIINFEIFYRNPNDKLRLSLGISQNAIVGIYVGKFGGLYYENEAFKIFEVAKMVFNKFHLLILTPDNKQWVETNILKNNFLSDEFSVVQASHSQVPDYLSIADFAFATYKPSLSKRHLSPIKVGEYWACGLPVLLTEGVGDDFSIIQQEKCGATFSFEKGTTLEGLIKIKEQLKGDKEIRERNRSLAIKYRNPDLLKAAYLKIIDELQRK